jgi:hypothetical protein
MDYIEFKLWKALAIVVLAFLAGLFGFLGPEDGDRSDRE